MPTINLSETEMFKVRELIDQLHDYFDKYADVVDGIDMPVANNEMAFMDRLELLDYIFNEKTGGRNAKT